MIFRMKIFRKKHTSLGVAFWVIFALCGCAPKTVVWNGDVEYYAHVTMAVDETDLYAYVGAADHVFVGTVEKIIKNVIPDRPEFSEEDLSFYKIKVDENLKGELVENIECSKHGGLKKDGTMMLLFSDNKYDSGLPQEGKQYIFLAYAQRDGSLMLSEFFDNRPYDEELLEEYLDYCKKAAVSLRPAY